MEDAHFAEVLRRLRIPIPVGSIPAEFFLYTVYDVAEKLGLHAERSRSPAAFVRERTRFFNYTPATRIEGTADHIWAAFNKDQQAAFVRLYGTTGAGASGTKRAREPATEGGSVSSSSNDVGLMDLPTEMRTVIRRFLSNANQAHVALVNKQFATEVSEGWHLMCRELVRHFHRTLPKAEAWVAVQVAADTGVNTCVAYASLLRALALEMAERVRLLMCRFEANDGYDLFDNAFDCRLVRNKRDFPAHSPDFLLRLRSDGFDEERYDLENRPSDNEDDRFTCFVVEIPEPLLAKHPRLAIALETANKHLARDSHGRVYTAAEERLAVLFYVLLNEVDPLAVLVYEVTFDDGTEPSVSLLGVETNGAERQRTADTHDNQRLADLPHYRDLDDAFFSPK